MTKDDREQLKELRQQIGNQLIDNGEAHYTYAQLKSINEAIAHLDQPYQWGDAVETSSDGEKWTNNGYVYVSKNPLTGWEDIRPGSDHIVIRWEGGRQMYMAFARHVRPISQTVRVTLDKELVERGKKTSGDENDSVTEILGIGREFCKAIASQEGGE